MIETQRKNAWRKNRLKDPAYNKIFSTYRRDYYLKNKARLSTQSYWCYILRRFGITEKTYVEMFESQEGKCAMCLVHQSEVPRRFAVDHDHETGAIRGLLCTPCNARLGTIEDKEFCLKATLYLQSRKQVKGD